MVINVRIWHKLDYIHKALVLQTQLSLLKSDQNLFVFMQWVESFKLRTLFTISINMHAVKQIT